MMHDGLLRAARAMIPGGIGRPSHALLRRSVSTAYYACFHRLTYDAARLYLSGDRGDLRDLIRRAFTHGSMRQVSSTLAAGNVPKRWPDSRRPVPKQMRKLCEAFVTLQSLRHRADYDPGVAFTKGYCVARVAEAEDFFRLADELSTDHRDVYEAFLVALLVQGNIR